MYTNRVNWETMQRFDTSTLTGSYQFFPSPLSFPSYILKMVNTSSSIVVISINGVDDIDILPGGSFWLYDEYKDLGREFLPAGTRIFVKLETGSAATAGSLYLVSQYLVTN